MADVRLTATNPADSSVVPVACNEKGELKLEEIPDQSFDGNLQGDLTVSGSAEFAGGSFEIYSGGECKASVASAERDEGAFNLATKTGDFPNRFSVRKDGSVYIGTWSSNAEQAATKLLNDGSAEFKGEVLCGTGMSTAGVEIKPTGLINLRNDTAVDGITIYRGGTATSNQTVKISAAGSATFAGNKAGFTAEGHLWCTTRRGDTVILDVTSNGLASWVPYTPPLSRRDEIKERWAEKNGIRPMPEESSQDEPETPQ